MKRTPVIFALALLVAFLSGCVAYQAPPPRYSAPPPPPARVVYAEPEYLYVIPTFGVYFVPGISAEIFFYSGRWYNRVGGLWYWSVSYGGPWTTIRIESIPRNLRRIPRDYRTRYWRDYYRVPYSYWKDRQKARPPKREYKEPSYLYKAPKPKTYIYPGAKDEVFFYKGRWYNRHKGVWYRGKNYQGPWNYTEVEKVPKHLRNMPPDYRKREKEYRKVPYEKLKKKKWKDKDDDNDDEDEDRRRR
jgi:hypothetical protein